MDRDLGVAAAIGAGVTLVSGVLPFVQLIAPMIGGGAAAYVSNASPKDGIKTGAAAGVLSLLVYVPMLLLGIAVFASSVATTTTVSGAEVGVQLVAMSFVAVLTTLIPITSALGGAVGGVVNERERNGTDHKTTAPDAEQADTPMERLEQRYVDGEIDETRFEQQLNTILESRCRYETPDGHGGIGGAEMSDPNGAGNGANGSATSTGVDRWVDDHFPDDCAAVSDLTGDDDPEEASADGPGDGNEQTASDGFNR